MTIQDDFFELAKRIDDNEDAINDALEADDFESALALTQEKVGLFSQLKDLSEQIEDRSSIIEYLKALYEATSEQLAFLEAEKENMRATLVNLKRGNRGHNEYAQVRRYVRG